MSTIYIDLYQNRLTKQWRWRAINAGNKRKLGHSGESYWNRQDCVDAIRQLFGDTSAIYLRQKDSGNELLRHPVDWPAS